jgi:hypothetical protein
MSDYTSVRNHLLELNDLPIANNLIGSKWGIIIAELRPLDDPQLGNKIEERKSEIYNLLTSAPTGISMSVKENRRLIILIIQILDELEFYNDEEYWRAYLEFRRKTFLLFLNNNLDAEAAYLFDNLRTIRKKADINNKELADRINTQFKNYYRKINKKLKGFEDQNDFNRAQFLNSIYSLHPEYEFESQLQEKENRYIRIPFFEIMVEVVIPMVLLSALLGISALSKNSDENNVFAYFTKGNFTFNDIILVFFIIYLVFWVFKQLDHSKINNRLKILFKVIIILSLFGSIVLTVRHQNNTHVKNYFPTNFNQDGKTRMLVMKFKPLVEHSVFDQNYSEINASQLFYKKMLTLNQNEIGLQDDSIIIDYYPNNYTIQNACDFDKMFCQKKYDAIINGEIIESNAGINVFTSLYCANKTPLINYFNDSIFDKTFNFNSLQLEIIAYEGFISSLDTFLTYCERPKNYYERICLFLNIKYKYKLKAAIPYGIENRVEQAYPSSLNFLNSLDVSPIICYNYIRMMKLLSENKNQSKIKLLRILSLIDNIPLSKDIIGDNSQEVKMRQLKLHLKMIKIYCLNELIKLSLSNTEKFDYWKKKIENINEALYVLCELNDISDNERDCILICNSFVNYYYLYTIKDLRQDSAESKFFYEIENQMCCDLRYKINSQINELNNRFYID